MKKILLLLVFISTASFAQMKVSTAEKPVEIGKIAPMGQLSISVEKYPGSYLFTYKDMKFSQIVSLKEFTIKENDFEDFYKIIVDGLANPPAEDIKIETEKDVIFLKFKKMLGSSYVEMYHAVNKSTEVMGVTAGLTKKQIDKIFGKKK